MKAKLLIIGVALLAMCMGSPAHAGNWTLISKTTTGGGQVTSSQSWLNYAWTDLGSSWYAYSWGSGSGAYIRSAGTFTLKYQWTGSGTPGQFGWNLYANTTEYCNTNTAYNSLYVSDGSDSDDNNDGVRTSLSMTKAHELSATVVGTGPYYLYFTGPAQVAAFSQAYSGSWNGEAGCGIAPQGDPF